MKLPEPVQTFFDADNRNDGDAFIRVFASDAVVADEGKSVVGRDAIAAWQRDMKASLSHMIEPVSVSEAKGVTRVHAKITGKFDGSPVERTFAFALKDGRIERLDIAE